MRKHIVKQYYKNLELILHDCIIFYHIFLFMATNSTISDFVCQYRQRMFFADNTGEK